MSKNPEASGANTGPDATHNSLTGNTPFSFSAETLFLLLELKGFVSDELETAILNGDAAAVHDLSRELPSNNETLSFNKLVDLMDQLGRESFKLMMLAKVQLCKLKTLLQRDINRSESAAAAIRAAIGAQAIQSLGFFERDALTDNP